ncbi:unnamed protein product [Symbiodinium microadriaticum]|nr:unnamed protein product [Symbiodinium microadriaticum]
MLACARSLVPAGAALHLLGKPLPKDPVSGKVDRRTLLRGLVGEARTRPVWTALRTRLKMQPLWLLAVALSGALNLNALLSWFICRKPPGRPGLRSLLQGCLHVTLAPYLWLLSLYISPRTCRSVFNLIPFGRLGALCLWYQLIRSGDARVRWISASAFAGCTGAGMGLAIRRGRCLPWWLTFWLAIPEIAEAECGWWLKGSNWQMYFDSLLSIVLEARSRSTEMWDGVVEVLFALPQSAREWKESLQNRSLPYEPPEELRGICSLGSTSGSHEQHQVLEGSTGMARDPAEPLALGLIIQDCDIQQPTGSAEAAAPSLELPPAEGPPACPDEAASPATVDVACPRTEEEELELSDGKEVSTKGLAAAEAVTCSDSENEAWTCVDCKCPLPWGSDWRQEDTVFYCKPCFNDFDNRWWDFHTRDVVDTDPAHDERCQDKLPDLGASDTPDALQSRSVAGTVLIQLLEPLLQGNLHADARLSGVDSLAVLTLCRQLRMAIPHLTIRPQDVFQCSTVQDLLSMVEKETDSIEMQKEIAPEVVGDEGVGRAVWFAPGQVKSTCKWLYGCRGLLDERCFRRAAAQLIARHEGLRAEFEDGAGMEILRFMRDVVPLHLVIWQELEKLKLDGFSKRLVRGCRRLVSAAFKGSWPRSVAQRVTKNFLEDRIWVVHCKTWREVEQASHRLRQEWEAPFTLGLFLLKGDAKQRVEHGKLPGEADSPEDWGAPSSFLQFVVSHAYSDGYSGVPLVQDFASLYAQEEEVLLTSPSTLQPASYAGRSDLNSLVPLPCGAAFEVLESRLFAAMDFQPPWSNPEQLSLRAGIFDELPKRPPWVYDHEVLLEGSAVEALQRNAKSYGLPFDVVLLSVVLAASFKATWSQEKLRCFYKGVSSQDFEASKTELSLPLTLYAPMRDGSLNDAMVGLFSDWRDVTIACSSSVSLLGFCLDVADLIRFRRWAMFDPVQNSNNILVNILPLDEQARGRQHFKQTRAHEYGGMRQAAADRRRAYKAPHRPMRITLEQEAPDAWWVNLNINADFFSTSWCRSFVKNLKECVQDLQRQPLRPVLVAGAG